MNRVLVATLAACLESLLSSPARADDPSPPRAATPAADPAPPGDPAPVPDPPPPVVVQKPEPEQILVQGSTLSVAESMDGDPRGTAEEFLVLPEGADVGGRLRTITADDGLGPGPIKLTDLALFEVDAAWAVARHYELDGSASVLAKQPSTTSEPIFQGGSLALRRDLVTRTAVAVSGSAAPLVGMNGLALGGAALVTHKHRLNDLVTFALAGGGNVTFIRATSAPDRPYLVEAAGHAAVLVHVMRIWGGWAGVGYALPVVHGGRDPVGGMPLDPQPRLDLDLGTAVQLADDWDLSVTLAIVDRGDLGAPATRLPILDGGFDQIQFTVAVSRRLTLGKHAPRSRRSYDLQMPM